MTELEEEENARSRKKFSVQFDKESFEFYKISTKKLRISTHSGSFSVKGAVVRQRIGNRIEFTSILHIASVSVLSNRDTDRSSCHFDIIGKPHFTFALPCCHVNSVCSTSSVMFIIGMTTAKNIKVGKIKRKKNRSIS